MKKEKRKFSFCLVDAGNTSIKIKLILEKKETLKRFSNLPSALEFLNNFKTVVDTAALSSVRDEKTTRILIRHLKQISRRFFRVKEAAKSLFKSPYDMEKLGEDRLTALCHALLNGYAPCVIVDAGTAITIDFLNTPNIFLGGYICAGFQTEYQALSTQTARLPLLEKSPKIRGNKIPQNTMEAISSGVTKVKSLGIATLINEQLKTQPHPHRPWKIILSGGDAKIIKKYFSPSAFNFMPEIVLSGLISMAKQI